MKDNGDNGLAQMLEAEGALDKPDPQPDLERIGYIFQRAKSMAAEGTLGGEAVRTLLAEIRPLVPENHAYLLEEYKMELLALIKR